MFCLPEIAVWQSDHRDQSSQIPISMTAIAYEAPLTAQVFISRSEANDIVQVSARPSAVWKWGLGFRASTLHPTCNSTAKTPQRTLLLGMVSGFGVTSRCNSTRTRLPGHLQDSVKSYSHSSKRDMLCQAWLKPCNTGPNIGPTNKEHETNIRTWSEKVK